MATKRKKKLYAVQWFDWAFERWDSAPGDEQTRALRAAEFHAQLEANRTGFVHRVIEHRPVKVVKVVRAKR